MSSSEDKGLGIKGWLSGRVPKVKPQESETAPVVLDKHRIAVLPFVNMSPDPADEYFADGMTEEIISTVAGISGLTVISRTSVMRYKKTEKAVEEIGRELKAGSVLEGSFRKAGNRIRVTTQLIDVATDGHLWAQNYDRTLDDIFAVQTDVAKQVAEALRVKIQLQEKGRIEKKPTESTTAYTLYLKGRYFWNMRNPDSLKRAREYFGQAVKEDPGFAPGYAGLADCCRILGGWNIDRERNFTTSKAMVIKALELNPELAEAHAANGLALMDECEFRLAEDEYKKAIELSPNYASAHQWYSMLLQSQLRWEEAREHIEKAVELDPLSAPVNQNHGFYYAYQGDYTRAIEYCKKAAELGAPPAHWILALVYGRAKMYGEMRREFEINSELLAKSAPIAKVNNEALAAEFEGDIETVRRLLPYLEAHSEDVGMDPYYIAKHYFCLGENDKGFEWLERTYAKNRGSLSDIQVDWDLNAVRTDPRYLDLLKRLGLG